MQQFNDLCAGRDGDIKKWRLKKPAHIVFTDIANEALQICFRKAKDSLSSECKVEFVLGDSFSFPIDKFMPNFKFHLASCQMAFHYSFESQSKVELGIKTLSSNLLHGGHIIIATINACKLVELFRRTAPSNKIGNELWSATRHFDLSNIPPFGAVYTFYLVDLVLNINEFLVHPAVLISLFKKLVVELVEQYEFQEYYQYGTQNDKSMKELLQNLLRRAMGNNHEEMSQSEWEVVGLYSFFVFKKPGNLPPISPETGFYETKSDYVMKIMDAETGKITEHVLDKNDDEHLLD